MGWSCGIVGMPNAGKSTLFKALTGHNVIIESYPFSTIEPNRGIVPIPDQRLLEIAELSNSEKITPATIEIIDVAGLVKGASSGEGLGNQFLGHLRNVDLLIHVVAGYDIHPNDHHEIASRVEIINLELILADLETINRRRAKLDTKLKSLDKQSQVEDQLLKSLEGYLNQGMMLNDVDLTPEERDCQRNLFLLTGKEMVYALNLAEHVSSQLDLSIFPGDGLVIPVYARLEADIVDLPLDEQQIFLQEYGLDQKDTGILLTDCYNRLRLLTFYTIKGVEARAWVAVSGISALEAAGKIHTDMERGFINVEVVARDNLITAGSFSQAREKGLSRVEGRSYQVLDGDVLLFRFRSQ